MSSDSDAELDVLPTKISADTSSYTIDFHSVTRGWNEMFPEKRTSPLVLDSTDAVLILFLTALGMITRVFRIQFPPYVVSDEYVFGEFINSYLTGVYFTDINPPLTKLIMAGIAHYSGYKADYNFEQIGSNKTYPNMNYIPLRITPAFFGALRVPLTYFTMRAMLCSHLCASVTAVLIASDLSLIVGARHILSDGILHFFSCLAIFSIFIAERYSSVFLFLLEGICLACVVSCKYTAGGHRRDKHQNDGLFHK
jgi:dolichyl-phosphate-mannose--protein O-mannosyl transferase